MGFMDSLNKKMRETAHRGSKNKNLSDEQREKWRSVEEELKNSQYNKEKRREDGYDD